MPRLTPEEYLALERKAETRSEYHDGVVVGLAGALWAHNVLVSNLAVGITTRVRSKGCQAITTDMKVWIPRTRRFLYPDVLVVCAKPEFRDSVTDVLLNPILIVEVLSISTEAYDRGEKFANYRTVDSLMEYVLVAQDRVQVESYLREDSGFWRYSAIEGDTETVPLVALSIELPLAEIYQGVELPSSPPG